jgi:hypothetical protein
MVSHPTILIHSNCPDQIPTNHRESGLREASVTDGADDLSDGSLVVHYLGKVVWERWELSVIS